MLHNNDLMTRNVGRYPPSQESLFCMLCAIEPQPQAERTLSGVIFRWRSAWKIYIDSCLQPSDTKYVVINRGGGLVYRGWTSSQIRQESILWNHVTKTAFQACWQHIDQCLCSSDLIQPKAYGRRKAQNLPVFWQQLQPCLEGSFYERWDKIF